MSGSPGIGVMIQITQTSDVLLHLGGFGLILCPRASRLQEFYPFQLLFGEMGIFTGYAEVRGYLLRSSQE